jgi:hypothetical protein
LALLDSFSCIRRQVTPTVYEGLSSTKSSDGATVLQNERYVTVCVRHTGVLVLTQSISQERVLRVQQTGS